MIAFKTYGLALFLALAFFMPAWSKPVPESARSLKAIERQTADVTKALVAKNMELGAPIFLRVIKSTDGTKRDGYLEAFVQTADGDFELFRSWDICTYSGTLGPKLKTGDKQSPEGFYFVKPGSMNPWSSYHLSFNLGYPNAYDRAHRRTGKYLMVHGDCVSIGCYAMTDDGIEEIYTLMNAAFENGQPLVRVHAFPFPMTGENLDSQKTSPNLEFWQNLKDGWDWFELNKRPPNVNVIHKNYVFSKTE